MKKWLLLATFKTAFVVFCFSQTTFPVNGVADVPSKYYAFTNATIVKDAEHTVSNATLIIKDGKIV
ncbi:hypothetical protein [Niabella drilacis]|uniref:Amidohydrolase family protein n=1 Tax=Niabella drilacis (strain DSM 25811 / CCM 8410 / CCUG 62505 / LMG 26954 / E90) TaxID=1285928 RepID=A0A1G6KUI3_NIADE|nr:hypothetical protein [Niabella drilacis]SDC34145.1 hypothetical protein SAMN04487894_10292 [Niabella drilacis]